MKKEKEILFEKMQQNIENLSEMLNSRIYNLMIEFADMRIEITKLRMNLHSLKDVQEK
jgi:hypothetical protein